MGSSPPRIAAGRQAALADNRAAIVEAATLGTRELIMVVGGLVDGDKDLAATRERVAERIAELVPFAAEHGVRLVLEPLHPMYAADRAVISTLGQALDLAAPHAPASVGVVIDTFHVWWDPDLAGQIARAGTRGPDRVVPGVRLQPADRGGRPALARHDGRRGDRLREHLRLGG